MRRTLAKLALVAHFDYQHGPPHDSAPSGRAPFPAAIQCRLPRLLHLCRKTNLDLEISRRRMRLETQRRSRANRRPTARSRPATRTRALPAAGSAPSGSDKPVFDQLARIEVVHARGFADPELAVGRIGLTTVAEFNLSSIAICPSKRANSSEASRCAAAAPRTPAPALILSRNASRFERQHHELAVSFSSPADVT